MKKFIHITFLTALILTSCVSSLQVNFDKDPTVDFSSFKTYYLLPWDASISSRVGMQTRAKLAEAMKTEMDRRGFVFQEKGGDLAVGVTVLVEEMIEYTSSGSVNHHMGWGGMGWGMGAWGMGGWGHPGMMGPGMGMGMTYTGPTTITPNKFKTGTLILDVFDAQKKQLIFESVGSDRLNSNSERERQRIPKYMRIMFKDFPVKPMK